jgi:capsular polysaccharide biosynthesis protein
MKWLFAPPSADDLAHLLRAWRFWVLGTLVGALLGTVVYYLFPPVYRARATVVVDFNLEQAWPQDTDRQLFYYLERETRKLEEIAWSDATLEKVASRAGDVSVSELRSGRLLLSQPGESGWHFWANDPDPARAAQLASAWAEAFNEQVQQGVVAAMQLEALHASLQAGYNCQNDPDLQIEIKELESRASGISPYIQVNASQVTEVPITRSIGLGTYTIAGALGILVLSTFSILFFSHHELHHASE